MPALSAATLDLRTVRVVFDAGVAAAALEADPYSLTPLALPAYTPEVVEGVFVNGTGVISDSIVDLVVDNDLSPGIQYTLTISGLVGVPDAVLTFVARAPYWPAERRMELWDVIPAVNKNEDTTQHLERFILCLQDALDTTLADIDAWTDILDSDRAPERYLDVMLADLDYEFAFEDLDVNEKRLLLRVLTKLRQLKGTDPGIEAALRFFMGLDSQISLFRNSGSLLGNLVSTSDLLNDSFVLGGGTPFDFALTIFTTGPAGRALTDIERTRIERIVQVMKPVNGRLIRPIFYGLPAPTSTQISGDSSSVTIDWPQTAQVPTNWRVYYRMNVPGVSQFNSARYEEVAGSTTTLTLATPVGTDPGGTTYFFTLVPYYNSVEGFHGPEVRNNLEAPAAVGATGGVRSVTVTWTDVVGATAYKVYKRLAGTCTPITADFAFEVLGGDLFYFDDDFMPGGTAHYCVVAMTNDSEGYYSTSVAGTAL